MSDNAILGYEVGGIIVGLIVLVIRRAWLCPGCYAADPNRIDPFDQMGPNGSQGTLVSNTPRHLSPFPSTISERQDNRSLEGWIYPNAAVGETDNDSDTTLAAPRLPPIAHLAAPLYVPSDHEGDHEPGDSVLPTATPDRVQNYHRQGEVDA